MSQRFSHVKYDYEAQVKKERFKELCEDLEALAETIKDNRAKSLFLTYLEIAYMWCGKAIRDEQIERDGAIIHQPARTDSPE